MALAKEAFLTSGHVATNIAGANVKWEAENKTVKATNAETWESTQMSRFQTFYSNELQRLYAHGDRGQAQETEMAVLLQSKIDEPQEKLEST